jgi:hypothetical protein
LLPIGTLVILYNLYRAASWTSLIGVLSMFAGRVQP